MHELSLSNAVVDTAVKHSAGRAVSVVALRVGGLRQVAPESLDFYFRVAARDTLCADARLEQDLVPARLRCNGCSRRWELEEPAFRCPACAGVDVEVISGDEFEVEWIEVEEEAGCTARG
jgi:hydrogenase nickel incorporation protein HypA/HybF